MKAKINALLIEIANSENLDIEDLVFAIAERIEALSTKTRANNGQFQVYFTDNFTDPVGQLHCYKPDKKSAIEESNHLNDQQGQTISGEYYVRSPGGYRVS